MKWTVTGALLSLALTGCAVGPTYQAPALPLLGTAPAQTPDKNETVPPSDWWTRFEDAQLDRLVRQALSQSPTLEAAAARVRQARAVARSAEVSTLPGASAGGTYRESGASAGKAVVSTTALDIGLELDLFGGNLRASQAAAARLEASRQAHLQARITLAAEVSSVYFGLAHCLDAARLQREDLASREKTLAGVRARVAAGASAPAEQSRAQASVAEARGTWLAQQATCQRTHNQLATLAGVAPAELGALFAHEPRLAPAPVELKVHMPANLLTHRPDVAAVERQLAAASADIGVAQAQLLPSITLAGSIGVNVANGASTQAWSWGPAVTLPLFDGGRRRAAVDAARARFDEAQANWRQAVLLATQEVEDVLVRFASSQRRAQSALQAKAQYQAYFAATQARFTHGAASLLELEEARRLMLASQQSALALHLEALQVRIALHKAAGGSWPVIDTIAAQAAAAEVYP